MHGNGKNPLRITVVGCGSIGRRHARNLRALGVHDLSVTDVDATRREQLAAELEVAPLQGLDAVWQWQPDAVVLAVPTSLHVTLALRAAERGCHLMIEKPLSDRWDGVEQLLEVVERTRLITLVGCNLRFDPGLVTIKNLLAERAVGRVIAARLEVGQYLPDWHPWEDYRQSYSARSALGGGVILDAIHEIDYARWLIGEVAGTVCLCGKLSSLEIDTEDTAAILLRFEDGALGEIHLDYVQRAYSRTCQIIGEEGTIRWDYTAGEVRWYSAHTRAWKVFSAPTGWQADQMYVEEMKHLLRCIAGEETPAVDVFDAARSLRVALAAKESARAPRWIELGG